MFFNTFPLEWWLTLSSYLIDVFIQINLQYKPWGGDGADLSTTQISAKKHHFPKKKSVVGKLSSINSGIDSSINGTKCINLKINSWSCCWEPVELHTPIQPLTFGVIIAVYFRPFACQFYLPTLAGRLGIADQISGQAMPVRRSAVWGSCGQRAMGAGATTDRWPQLVIDPTLNRIIAGPKQPRLQNPPGLPEKGGVVSVSDGRREEGWRWMWKRASGVTAQGPIDLLIISHPSLLLSGLLSLPPPNPPM